MFIDMDKAIRTLWQAERVCIFGLSLDPLDAELALIVTTGLNRLAVPLQEVRVCNLASEGAKICDRVRMMLPPGSVVPVVFEAV